MRSSSSQAMLWAVAFALIAACPSAECSAQFGIGGGIGGGMPGRRSGGSFGPSIRPPMMPPMMTPGPMMGPPIPPFLQNRSGQSSGSRRGGTRTQPTPTYRVVQPAQPVYQSQPTYRVVESKPAMPTSTTTSSVLESPVKASPMSEVRSIVEECKKLFRKGEYRGAADKLDRVVELAKEDTNAYQFRSYAYFAAGNFDAAAADAYDALLLGNTWDWQAVYDLYGSDKTYTKHLRELEQLSKKSPSMSNHFLLAYQYLVLNHLDYGQKQLEKALALQPGEPLMTQLLAVVKQVQAQKATTK